MTAPGEPSPGAKHTANGRKETPSPAKPSPFSAAKLKELFGKLAEAVTGKPTPSLAKWRKRREDTGRMFRKAVALTRRAVRSFFRHPAQVFDVYERRAEAERVLRAQPDEWANEDQTQEHDSGFHYTVNSGFDAQP